jgi:hypothetical protein
LTESLRTQIKFINKKESLVTNPPSFYDEDVANYAAKFDRAVKMRKEFKQRYFPTRDFSILTSNYNAQLDFDANHSIHRVTGGQLFPAKSEF